MDLRSFFTNLNINKDLIIYLFKNDSISVDFNLIEDKTSLETLEKLEFWEIIEKNGENFSLDSRIISFLDSYLDLDENLEISKIDEFIKSLKHNIELSIEFRQKQKNSLIRVRKDLKKCNFTIIKSLEKLRIYINRVYKSIDSYALKLKELEYYKERLQEFDLSIKNFEDFLFMYEQKMLGFFDKDLNEILKISKAVFVGVNKTLIKLTYDVIEYINKTQKQTIVLEKISKLKELKDRLSLEDGTNINQEIKEFDALNINLNLKTRLNSDIVYSDDFFDILDKLSNNIEAKRVFAGEIDFNEEFAEYDYLDVISLNSQFKSSNFHLIEFLINNNLTKNKTVEELAQIYCKMVLLYEDEYKILENSTKKYFDINFKEVRYV